MSSYNQKNYEIIQTLFSITYHVLWLFPLYGVSFILNTFWYADIAVEAMAIEKKKYKNEGIKTVDIDLATRLYHELVNVLVIVFFMIQSTLLSLMFRPYVGMISDIIHSSFMYAFFAFTYKWGTDQIDFMHIMGFFDKHFAYFCGFGFCFTITTRIFPGMMSNGVYALSFPILLLLSIKAAPPKEVNISSWEELGRFVLDENKNRTDDHIYSFNYNQYNEDKKRQIGIFSFSVYCIKAIQRYLDQKVKL